MAKVVNFPSRKVERKKNDRFEVHVGVFDYAAGLETARNLRRAGVEKHTEELIQSLAELLDSKRTKHGFVTALSMETPVLTLPFQSKAMNLDEMVTWLLELQEFLGCNLSSSSEGIHVAYSMNSENENRFRKQLARHYGQSWRR